MSNDFNDINKQFIPENIPPADDAWQHMKQLLDAEMPTESIPPGGSSGGGKKFLFGGKWFIAALIGLVVLTGIYYLSSNNKDKNINREVTANDEAKNSEIQKTTDDNQSSNNNDLISKKNNNAIQSNDATKDKSSQSISDVDNNKKNDAVLNAVKNIPSKKAGKRTKTEIVKTDDNKSKGNNSTTVSAKENKQKQNLKPSKPKNNFSSKIDTKNNSSNKADRNKTTTGLQTNQQQNMNADATSSVYKYDINNFSTNNADANNSDVKNSLAGNSSQQSGANGDLTKDTITDKGYATLSANPRITLPGALPDTGKINSNLNTDAQGNSSEILGTAAPAKKKSASKSINADVDFGLQLNPVLPINGGNSYSNNLKGDVAPYVNFIPGVYLSLNNKKSNISFEINPWHVNYFSPKTFYENTIRDTVIIDSFINVQTTNTSKSFLKTFSFNAGISYNHKINNHLSAGLSLRGNFGINGLVRQSGSFTGNGLTTIFPDSLYKAISADLKYLSKSQYWLMPQVLYTTGSWQFGLRGGMPLNKISLKALNTQQHPFNAEFLIRFNIGKKK